MPRTLFISYSREDKVIAKQVADALAYHGYDIFWDVKIPTGEKFDTYLFRKLNDSDAVVVLWSVNSVKSDYVKEEAEFGKNNSALVPLRIDQTSLPFGFTRIQTTDIVDWCGSVRAPEWQLVVDSIEATLGGETPDESDARASTVPTKPVGKRGVHLSPFALVAIAVVTIALLGFFAFGRHLEDGTDANVEASSHEKRAAGDSIAASGEERTEETTDTADLQDAGAAQEAAIAALPAQERRPSRSAIATRRPADLTVMVFPWGDVWINGKAKGSAPLKNQSLKPGRYKITVRQESASETRTVRLAPGEERTLYFDLTK